MCYHLYQSFFQLKYTVLICSFRRNLDVAEDTDIGKDGEEDGAEIVPGLQCKIVVRFEKHRDFYTALKILSGRSLEKVNSRFLFSFIMHSASCFTFKQSPP